MSKEDYVWVGIRIFGIYLIVLAVLSLPSLVNSAFMVAQFAGGSSLDIQGSDLERSMGTMDRTIYWNSVSALVGTALRLIVCAAFGLYFLRSGEFVFRLASRPLSGEAAGSETR